MSVYLSGATCATAADKVLYSALTDYFADRQRWVRDERTGRMRPKAEHRIGICAVCGSALAEHFMHSTRHVFLGPDHAEYAVARAEVVESYRSGAATAWNALPVCQEAMDRKRPRKDVLTGTHGNEHLIRLADAASLAADEIIRAERKRIGEADTEQPAPAAPKVATRDSLKKP